MYVPDHFRESDTQVLQQYIRDYGFGVLVVSDEEGIEANHVPFHLQVDNDSGILRCHVARNKLKKHLQNLTEIHESGRQPAWSFDDAFCDFTDNLMRAIVGIEIKIEKLTGKLKASQNQPERNRAGVKSGLAQSIFSARRC